MSNTPNDNSLLCRQLYLYYNNRKSGVKDNKEASDPINRKGQGNAHMQWFEKCLLELTHHNMFESTAHRNRFQDLISCYCNAPFFCKGLCKCMYLSSWDEEHFEIMLTTMNEMVINGEKNVRDMARQGMVMAAQSTGYDQEIYKLSASFLTNSEYTLPDLTVFDPDGALLIRKAILAGKYIDDLPEIPR